MIDQAQIQRILQEVKVSSISDIITFIAQYVSKIALQSVEDIQERLTWLEKPKGMDRIMIQEVKALVQAMLDQRQQAFHKQIDRKCRQNACNSFQIPQNSRRSLNQIDFINIMNMQKGTQSQQLRKTSSNFNPPIKFDAIVTQLREIRQQISSKPQRKDLQDLRVAMYKFDKELVSKVTFQQAQKLILKFERDIFLKINQNKGNCEEIENKMMRRMHDQIQRISNNFQETIKVKGIGKLEKKLRNFSEEMIITQNKVDKIDKSIGEKHKIYLQNFENVQTLISQISEEKSELLISQNKREQSGSYGFWMSSPPTYKNSQVVWERQLFNSDTANLEFESGKTGIRLITAGFYEICCSIFGGNGSMKKPPSLICNSELVGKLQTCCTSSQSLPRWRFRELVHVRQNRSTLAVRFDSEQNSSCIILTIRKASY